MKREKSPSRRGNAVKGGEDRRQPWKVLAASIRHPSIEAEDGAHPNVDIHLQNGKRRTPLPRQIQEARRHADRPPRLQTQEGRPTVGGRPRDRRHRQRLLRGPGEREEHDRRPVAGVDREEEGERETQLPRRPRRLMAQVRGHVLGEHQYRQGLASRRAAVGRRHDTRARRRQGEERERRPQGVRHPRRDPRRRRGRQPHPP